MRAVSGQPGPGLARPSRCFPRLVCYYEMGGERENGNGKECARRRNVVRGGGVRTKTGTPIPRGTQRVVTTRRRFENEDISRRSDCNSAPGFGFDAVHQVAVCGSSGVDSRRRGLQVPLFFPFFDGGFFLPGSSGAVEDNSAAEATRQEEAEAESRERSRRYRASLQAAAPGPAAPEDEAANPAPRGSDEFVYVRRHGTPFFPAT